MVRGAGPEWHAQLSLSEARSTGAGCPATNVAGKLCRTDMRVPRILASVLQPCGQKSLNQAQGCCQGESLSAPLQPALHSLQRSGSDSRLTAEAASLLTFPWSGRARRRQRWGLGLSPRRRRWPQRPEMGESPGRPPRAQLPLFPTERDAVVLQGGLSARYSRWLRCPKRPPAGSCALASEVTGPQAAPPEISLTELSPLA